MSGGAGCCRQAAVLAADNKQHSWCEDSAGRMMLVMTMVVMAMVMVV